MKSPTATLLILTALTLSPLASWSQTNNLTQTFDSQTTASLPYTTTGAGGVVSAMGVGSTNGYRIVKGNNGSTAVTGTIETDVIRVTPSATTTTFQLSLAVTGTGLHNGDGSVVIALRTNSGSYGGAGNTMTITGPTSGNADVAWAYGTGSAGGTMGSLGSVSITSGGAGAISITLPANTSSVQARISLDVPRQSGFNIDNVQFNSNQPLPVELTAFDAIRQNNTVLLKWATASEKNNDRFEVQRSPDGQKFVAISTVSGSGTSNKATSYSFKDTEPLAGDTYYRLRQVDTDGTESYSPVRVVRAMVETAYPSPTYDRLNLPLSAAGTPYRILNSLGQILLQGTVPANGTVDVQHLTEGSYLLETGSGHDRATQRFVRR